MNMMGKNGVNGGFHKNNGESSTTRLEAEALCPICEGDDRHFYMLTNGSVILYCEECSAYWLKPENISSRGAVDRYTLEKYFGNISILDLFNEKGKPAAHWATEEEIKKSEWNHIAGILTY